MTRAASALSARPGDHHDVRRAARFWARYAPRYDRSIAVFERLLFGEGRSWACSHARGEVLEVEELERSKIGIVERLTARKPG